MSGLGGMIADLERRGISPRQHFDQEWGIPERIVTYSARVVRNPKRDAFDYGGPAIEDPTVEVGDDLGWHLWPAKSKQEREISGWFSGCAPATIAGGEVVPLRGPDQPDTRFKGRAQSAPSWATLFPNLWSGTAGAGSEEWAQLETWHPDFLGLVAVNAAGKGIYGTRVFDLNAGSAVDPQRWAYLQSLVSVVPLGAGGCQVGGDALALQLGKSGQDQLSGGGLYVEWFEAQPGAVSTSPRGITKPRKLRKVTGVMSASLGSGPLLTGGENDVHRLGVDKDGHPINAMHFSTKALWKGNEGDGPMYFGGAWLPVEPDGPFLQRTYLRWNSGFPHTFCKGQQPGHWEWQTPTWFYVPDPEPEGDPEPKGDPEPRGDPPPFVPPGEDLPGTIFGDPILVNDGRPTTGQTLPPAPGFYGAVGRPVTGGTIPPPPEFFGAVGRGGVKLVGDRPDPRPNYAQAANCMIFAGGVVRKAAAWAQGALDFTGARGLTQAARQLLDSAPAVSKTQGFAPGKEGNGSWFDWIFEDTGKRGMPRPGAAGAGDVYLPIDRLVADAINGEDYAGHGVALHIPTKTTCVSFGNPTPTGGFQDQVTLAPKDDGSDIEVTYYNSSGTGTTRDLLDAFSGGGVDPGTGFESGDVLYTAPNGATIRRDHATETLSDGSTAVGTARETGEIVPLGARILWTTSRVDTEPDGTGTGDPGDQYTVGNSGNTSRWGNSGGTMVAGTTTGPGSTGYNSTPIAVTSSALRKVRVTPSGWAGWGSGEITVTVFYETATPATS